MANGNSTKRLLTELPNCLTGNSAPLPNLPEEIITEILLRLPVKSLLKFRSVSKSWLSSISRPQFIQSHFKISTKNNTGRHNKLIVGSSARPAAFHTFSLNPNKNSNSSVDSLIFDHQQSDAIRIVGSCNGLVCVALNHATVVIWNPATRKSKMLPISDSNIVQSQYGFGYDAVKDDYKVVQFGLNEYDENQIKIYSSRASSWRTSVSWAGDMILLDYPGVFVDGAIHWKVWRDDNACNVGMMAQNVTTEACSSVELPVAVNGGGDEVVLGVWGGWLCASYDHGRYMDVWVMKEYGVKDSWTKLVCFPYFFRREQHPSHVRPRLLFMSENGGILLNLGSDLIMYKPSDLYHEVHRLGYHVEIEAATYCESLLSPEFDRMVSSFGADQWPESV